MIIKGLLNRWQERQNRLDDFDTEDNKPEDNAVEVGADSIVELFGLLSATNTHYVFGDSPGSPQVVLNPKTPRVEERSAENSVRGGSDTSDLEHQDDLQSDNDQDESHDRLGLGFGRLNAAEAAALLQEGSLLNQPSSQDQPDQPDVRPSTPNATESGTRPKVNSNPHVSFQSGRGAEVGVSPPRKEINRGPVTTPLVCLSAQIPRSSASCSTTTTVSTVMTSSITTPLSSARLSNVTSPEDPTKGLRRRSTSEGDGRNANPRNREADVSKLFSTRQKMGMRTKIFSQNLASTFDRVQETESGHLDWVDKELRNLRIQLNDLEELESTGWELIAKIEGRSARTSRENPPHQAYVLGQDVAYIIRNGSAFVERLSPILWTRQEGSPAHLFRQAGRVLRVPKSIPGTVSR